MKPAWRKVIRLLLMLLALGLLAAAAWSAGRQVDWSALKQITPSHWLLMIAAVLANLLLTGAMFWAVTLCFDAKPRVTYWRMTLLITASALLNFLPLRPGLLGRAAVLKAHHQLPVRQSFLSLMVVLVVGTLVTLTIGLLAWLIPHAGWLAMAIGIATLILAALAGPVATTLLRRPAKHAWCWVVFRVADALVAGLRLWIAFAILGLDLDYRQALIAGAGGLLIAMIGLTPNGLGLKEWFIALLMQSLSVTSWEQALGASLIDRGVEALVVVAAGLIALFCLRSLWKPQSDLPSHA